MDPTLKRTRAKELILNYVTESQGCKAMQLVVAPGLANFVEGGDGLWDLLDEMVQEGELVELEYTLEG